MAVTRDYTPDNFLGGTAPVQGSAQAPQVTGGGEGGGNALLQGSVSRTSGTFGRSATVKAGEDIRPALESLKSAGGGTLILLAGVHRPDYDIELSSNISIFGEGSALTIIDFIQNTQIIAQGVDGTPLSDIKLSGFTVKNSWSAGIYFKYVSYFLINDVVSESNSNGFYLYGCTFFKVEQCHALSNNNIGFVVYSNSGGTRNNNFVLQGCIARSNGSDGFSISSSFIYNTDYVLESCRAELNGGDGFYTKNLPGSFYSLLSVNYIFCISSDNTLNGFLFEDANPDTHLFSCRAVDNGADGFVIGDYGCRVNSCVSGDNLGKDYVIGGNTFFVGNDVLDINFKPIDRIDVTNASTSSNSPRDSFSTRRDVRLLFNNRPGGNSIKAGNVVVADYTNTGIGFQYPDGVNLTTTAGDSKVVGVMLATGSRGFSRSAVVQGMVYNLTVNGVTNIAPGDFLSTYTEFGIAAKASTGHTAFAIAMEAYTANDSDGVIDALVISPRKI